MPRVCYAVLTDPPGKPGRPEVVDYDKDRAEIKWTHPKSDGGSPLSKYIIEKKMKGGPWEKVCCSVYFVSVGVTEWVRIWGGRHLKFNILDC